MRYKCTVSYIGKNYSGWQTQRKGDSIQEKIESALYKITQEDIAVTASGRTDAGVNAKGQVFMFDSDKPLTSYKWKGAINAFLPEDIHILDVEGKDDIFHARYNVRYKKYTYRINNGPYDVFSKDYALQYDAPLDLQAMKECAEIFVGTHDFTSFNSSSLQEYPIQVRPIYSASVEKQGDMITITFVGKGFLRYMVRMMVYSIMDVGRGKCSIEEVKDMLEAKNRQVKRHSAEAHGLTLEYVDYFEMVSLNEHIQIREFLRSDVLPNVQWDIEDLEARVKNNIFPKAYAVCTRNNQEMKGCLILDKEKASIYLYDLSDQKYIDEVKEQIKQHISMDFSVESYENEKNYLNDAKSV